MSIVHKTTEQDLDSMFLILYSEWLMDQPEAQITDGDKLIQRIEQGYALEDFLRQLPEQLEMQVRKYLETQ